MKDYPMSVNDMTDQELETHTAKLLFRLVRAAEESVQRTCGKCAAGDTPPALNAQAERFKAAVAIAKAEGTILADMTPDITVNFGGK